MHVDKIRPFLKMLNTEVFLGNPQYARGEPPQNGLDMRGVHMTFLIFFACWQRFLLE